MSLESKLAAFRLRYTSHSQVVDGVAFPYFALGAAAAASLPAVVILPGLLGVGEMSFQLAEALAARHRVLVPSWPRDADRADLWSGALPASSMRKDCRAPPWSGRPSGLVAQRFVVRYPERVSHLVPPIPRYRVGSGRPPIAGRRRGCSPSCRGSARASCCAACRLGPCGMTIPAVSGRTTPPRSWPPCLQPTWPRATASPPIRCWSRSLPAVRSHRVRCSWKAMTIRWSTPQRLGLCKRRSPGPRAMSFKKAATHQRFATQRSMPRCSRIFARNEDAAVMLPNGAHEAAGGRTWPKSVLPPARLTVSTDAR